MAAKGRKLTWPQRLDRTETGHSLQVRSNGNYAARLNGSMSIFTTEISGKVLKRMSEFCIAVMKNYASHQNHHVALAVPRYATTTILFDASCSRGEPILAEQFKYLKKVTARFAPDGIKFTICGR